MEIRGNFPGLIRLCRVRPSYFGPIHNLNTVALKDRPALLLKREATVLDDRRVACSLHP